MEVAKIQSFEELSKNLEQSGKSYLILYKSGTAKSQCAYHNLAEALTSIDKEISVVAADVSNVRDIHEKYNIDTVPTLLYFEGHNLKKTIRGCHSASFYVSLFEDSIYSSQPEKKEKQKRVIVYSTPTCPHCNNLKKYLKQNKVSFKDIDVSKDQKMAQELVRKSGQQGVPQTEINGRIVVGFNRLKINELLGLRG
ncbi:MAG: glutaredoxin domain-containing protein [Bacteroidales bacterium]